MDKGLNRDRLKRAMSYAFPFKKFIYFILVLTFLIASTNVIEPLILKFIFDNLIEGKDVKIIIYGIIELVLLGIIRELFSAASNWLSWHTRLGIYHNLLSATVERLHRLPLDYQREEGVGAIMTRMDRGIQGFIGAITEISFNVLPALAYLVVAVFVMIQLDWRLTILVSFFTPIPAIIAALAADTQTKREQNLLNKWAKIYSRFNEVLSGIVTVRSFAMEDAEKKRFLTDVGNANKVVVNGVKYDSFVGALQNFIILLARISAITLGGYLVIIGEATIGTLIAFLGYVSGLFGPVQGLTGIYKILRTASVSINQIFSILDTQDKLGDSPDAVELKNVKGNIAFEDIHFHYRIEYPLIKGISLNVSKGEMIAIVGPSGSGKSTLMALLQRFYDPVKGKICIDTYDLRSLKQASIRRNIGVVLQDALLFNDTVRDNIAYAKPMANQKEIEACAKAANAHDFIVQLEKQYDTSVGERGSRLSVGERQRIAIARALLKDPPILILDEATSALDPELENLVQEALERLVKGRTTFVIAHRLSTVVNADRIIVLKEGIIIEQGSHIELMKDHGYYASLVKRQTKGLINPDLLLF